MSMNISLSPELEQKIYARVQSGEYASANDVIKEALRLMEEQDELEKRKFEALKCDLDEGLAEADRGELIPGEEVFAEILASHKAAREKK